MFRGWLPGILDVAREGTTALLVASLKVALLVLLLGSVALLARRSPAAFRHRLWLLALAGSLIVPLLSPFVPRWAVLPSWAAPSAPSRPPEAVLLDPAMGVASIRPAPLAANPSSGAPTSIPEDGRVSPPAGASVPPWISALWAVGVLAGAVRLVRGIAAVRRSVRASAPVRDRAWTELLAEGCRVLGVRARVELRRAGAGSMPAVWGLRRPVLLLPAEAEEWPRERRRAVLLHELAHVLRHDCATSLVARVGAILHWWNPLVRLALRRLEADRESACDDLVVERGRGSRIDYADHVLAVVSRATAGPALAGVVPMAQRSHLAGRIAALLDARRDRRSLSRRAGAMLAGAGASLALALASLGATAPAQSPASTDPSAGLESDDARAGRLLSELRALAAPVTRRAKAEVRDLDPRHPVVVRIVDALLLDLESPLPDVRRAASWALGRTGHPLALDPLLRTLGDEVGAVRAAAAGALGELGDVRAFEPLLDRLPDAEPLAREWAVRALGALGDPRAIDPLADRLFDPEATVREWAVRSLATFDDPRIGDLFVPRLADPDRDVREWAVRSLARRRDPRDVEPLVVGLADEDQDVREWAIRSLAAIGDPRAIGHLRPLLEDDDEEIREWSRRALETLEKRRER